MEHRKASNTERAIQESRTTNKTGIEQGRIYTGLILFKKLIFEFI